MGSQEGRVKNGGKGTEVECACSSGWRRGDDEVHGCAHCLHDFWGEIVEANHGGGCMCSRLWAVLETLVRKGGVLIRGGGVKSGMASLGHVLAARRSIQSGCGVAVRHNAPHFGHPCVTRWSPCHNHVSGIGRDLF